MKNNPPSLIYIKNAQVIIKDSILKGASVSIDGGEIAGIGESRPANAITIDARGLFVSPGFIDSHIHGDPAEILAHEIRYGTTAIVPAISCASPDAIAKKVRRIREFKMNDPLGSAVLGLRIEGPYINPEKAGAQNKKFIKMPSASGLRRLIKTSSPELKILTLAPEMPPTMKLIKILRKSGIIASIGHSNAAFEQARRGIDAGIRHATHLFNAMSPVTPGDAGVVGASLTDKRVMVEIICDLVHVPALLIHFASIIKDRKNIVLITDSVRAEMPGRRTAGGVYRLKNGTIAGSKLTMIEAVKNAVTNCGVTLNDTVAFASANPARLLGVGRSKGSIERGKDADIVLFDKDFDVKMTIARGRILYRKRGF